MGIKERPEAMSLAHRGLTGAAWRTLYSMQRKHILSSAVAATEAVNWVCALDEQLRKEDGGYVVRRDGDEEGQVIPGLRYARDRSMHQVVICTSEDARSFYRPRRGVVYIASSFPIWAPTDSLPDSENKDTYDLKGSYENYVAEQRAHKPLFEALNFMTRELTGLVSLVAIGQPDWFQELTDEEKVAVSEGPMMQL